MTSNTKVKRFLDYADGVEPFRKITEEAKQPNAYTVMRDMDQEKTCEISQAADLCNFLTAGLKEHDDVHWFKQKIFCAMWSQVSFPTETRR
jgi:alpha-1,3/alpha-1,6-mannosyltransferase